MKTKQKKAKYVLTLSQDECEAILNEVIKLVDNSEVYGWESVPTLDKLTDLTQ